MTDKFNEIDKEYHEGELEGQEYFEEDNFYLNDENYFGNDEEDFEWNYPSPGLVPPTDEELESYAAFNRELDLILIPDWEKNKDWM